MEKDEILRRSRNSKQDDGADYAENQGRKLAVVVFAFVAGVIAIVCVTRREMGTLYAVMGLLLTYIACESYGTYYFAGKKIYILAAVASAIAAVGFLATFFLLLPR